VRDLRAHELCTFIFKNPISTKYHIIHENKTYKLDKPDSINDLGAILDSNLSFRDHISQKTNKAYSILGIIKTNFIYTDEASFMQLYKLVLDRVRHFQPIPIHRFFAVNRYRYRYDTDMPSELVSKRNTTAWLKINGVQRHLNWYKRRRRVPLICRRQSTQQLPLYV